MVADIEGDVTGAVTGNASTATALATARTIGGTSFDGTANIAVALSATTTALASARTIHGVSFDGTANIDLSEVVSDTVGAMFSSNTETGITATYQDGDNTIDLVVGTLNQDTTGLAATATALATARTIHGVSFDGTANIDLSEVVADTVGAMFSSNTETNITATYQDGDNTIDLVIGTLNQDTTGLAATATALATGRTIALSGDIAASGVSFDGTGNITLSTTIQANSVALATDTTGNYIATIADAGNSHITVANSGSENAGVTLNITDNAIGIAQLAGIARGKIIYGDASGNPALLALGSDGEVLKSDGTDIAWSADAGLSTEAVQDIVGAMFSSNTETGVAVTYEDGDGTIDLVVATLNQDTTGLAGTATALATGRTIGMTGDVVWTSASFDGSGNVTGSAVIQANSVALGTDTTGNYVDNVTGGTGVSVSGSAGEGWEPAISIGQAVGTSDSVTFGSLVVDNFTLNGTELDLSSGDFTLDVAGDIILDADGGDIFLHDGGTQFGKITNATNNITKFNTVDAFIVPLGTTGQRPTGTAGMFRYNSTDGKFEGYTNAWGEIGGGGSGLFTTNKFTGNGSTTAFTMSTAPADENYVVAFIDGVYQNKDAFNVSGTTITFDTAPANSKTVIVHVVGSTVSGANANLDSFTGDGSETEFTLNLDPITENNTQVYIDGVYQMKSGYAVSGTTLTLSAAPANGSAIEVATFTQNTLNAPANDSVTGAKIADNAVDSEHYVDGSIDLVHMSANSVDSAQYVDGSIDLAHMSVNSIDSDQYVDGSIDTAHIANSQITNALMADDAIDSAEIADGSIDLAHMSVNSIDSDQYVDGSIDLVHMSANSVDSDQYVDGSIDLVHMSANSVDSDQYVDGSIDAAHLASNAVTSAKLDTNIAVSGTLGVTGATTFNALTTSTVAAGAGDAVFRWAVAGNETWQMGIDNSDADKLKIGGGSNLGTTDYMTFYGNKIGIGTATPDCPLHINGSANSEQVIITGNNNAGRGLSISTAANGGQQDALVIFNAQDTGHADYPMMTFQTGGTERMRINPNGNVNIGIGGSGGDLLLQPLAKLYLDAGGNTYIVESSGDVIDFYTGGAERMKINSSGISVTGNVDITDHVRSSIDGTASNPNFQVGADADTGMYQPAVNQLGFTVAGSRKMYFSTTTAYMQNLTGGLILDAAIGTRGAGVSEMSVTSGSNGNQTVVWRFGANAGNTIGYFVNNNNAGVYMNSGSTSWSAHSDERIKENITLLGTVLPSIDSLRCVKYNKIGDTSTNKTKIGFIAQDWESTAFSEVVDEDDGFVIDDGLVVKHDESESTTVLKGISYSETIPVLLKAIQELKAENTALKARVTTLEDA